MPRTFLFLGDSITDSHRFWIPETNSLGDGYVSMLYQDLTGAGQAVRFINRGHNGFTVPALLRSLSLDELPKADFISVLIGINDVGVAMENETTLDALRFAEDYAHLLDILQSRTDASLLCAGPFLFPHPQKYLLWMKEVRKAEETVAALAEKAKIPFLPLHDTLNNAAETYGYDAITVDGIHLTGQGHRLLADLVRPYLG